MKRPTEAQVVAVIIAALGFALLVFVMVKLQDVTDLRQLLKVQ